MRVSIVYRIGLVVLLIREGVVLNLLVLIDNVEVYLIGSCLVEGDGSHLGLGSGVTLSVRQEAVQVELVHLRQRSGGISLVIAGDFGNGQTVVDVLVNHCQEVAVEVHTIALKVGVKVTLVVVELQTDEVVPTGDDHAGLVARCMESGALLSHTINLIFKGVAVLVLRHFINHLGNDEGVVAVVTRQFVAVDVIELNALGLEQAAVAILIDEIDGVNLGHGVARHLVKRGNPSQGDIIVQVVGAMIGSLSIANKCCGSIQGNPVDTYLGSIFLVILGKICRPVAEVSIGVYKSVAADTSSGIDALISVHVTAINGVGAVVINVGSVPEQQSVVGAEEVHAREGIVISTIVTRQ